MSEEMLLKQVRFVRAATLHSVIDVTEEEADVIPDGFNNNIRWNLGHILATLEAVFLLSHEKSPVPKEYKDLFGRGTKPADWSIQPPTLDTLRRELEEQVTRIEDTFAFRMFEKMAAPFSLRTLEFTTPGDLLVFMMFHEGMHNGSINALKRAVALQKQ